MLERSVRSDDCAGGDGDGEMHRLFNELHYLGWANVRTPEYWACWAGAGPVRISKQNNAPIRCAAASRTRCNGDGISSKSSTEYMKRRTRHIIKPLPHKKSTLQRFVRSRG